VKGERNTDLACHDGLHVSGSKITCQTAGSTLQYSTGGCTLHALIMI